jgi:hypothetical protein
MSKEELKIRIFDIDKDDHTVPAEVLIHVLQHLQQSVFLIAMDNEGVSISQRARPTADIRKTYTLRCSVPISGSYALPMVLGDPTGNMFASEKITSVAETLESSLDAVASGATAEFNKLFRSTDCRNKVAEAIKALLPKPGEQWKVGFSRAVLTIPRPEIILSAAIHKRIQELIRPIESEVVPQTVNGYLHAMDFAKHSITIQHPETQKQLECYYDESLEIALVENRRELVQVTGTVVLDVEGGIKEIIAVESIEAVDMSDFVIDSIPYLNGMLKSKVSLVFTPTLNDSKQLLCIENGDLGIDVFASTREQLFEELQEQIGALWLEYALEVDEKLTPSALELKRHLFAAFAEVKK